MNNVCRLCLGKDNLVWVFDQMDNMKYFVQVTTGVEIHEKDIVSQMICEKCRKTIADMYHFRTTSLKNDKYLKEQCKNRIKDKSMKIPNTEVTIRYESFEMKEIKQEFASPFYNLHPSMADLYKKYPEIKLPSICMSTDINPFVSMPMNDVENYFQNKNLDFSKHSRLALKPRNVARKRTSSIKPKSLSSYPKTNKLIAEIIPFKDNDRDEQNAVHPIKIRITQTNNFNNTSTNKIEVSQNRKIFSNEKSTVDKNLVPNRKRRYSQIDECENSESEKITPTNLLSLTHTINTPSTQNESTLSYVDKFVPLHICDICDSVHYNVKDLKKHQSKHLMCQFCKQKFRNLDQKNEHLENLCVVKNTMVNVPDIVLDKIEYNIEVRRKYPEAFVDIPPIDNQINMSDDLCSNSVISKESNSGNSKCCSEVTSDRDITKKVEMEVIEIDDDDDEIVFVDTAASANKKVDLTYNEIKLPVIKPNIVILSTDILNEIDPKLSDLKILKQLLKDVVTLEETDSVKIVPEVVDKDIQTNKIEIPVNRDILVDRKLTAELKHLTQQIYMHEIPVTFQNGIFNVSYQPYEKLTKLKRLHMWNDVKPIDIVTNSNETSCKVANILKENDIEKHENISNTSTNTCNSVTNASHTQQNITSPKPLSINNSLNTAPPNSIISTKTANINILSDITIDNNCSLMKANISMNSTESLNISTQTSCYPIRNNNENTMNESSCNNESTTFIKNSSENSTINENNKSSQDLVSTITSLTSVMSNTDEVTKDNNKSSQDLVSTITSLTSGISNTDEVIKDNNKSSQDLVSTITLTSGISNTDEVIKDNNKSSQDLVSTITSITPGISNTDEVIKDNNKSSQDLVSTITSLTSGISNTDEVIKDNNKSSQDLVSTITSLTSGISNTDEIIPGLGMIRVKSVWELI